MWSNVDMVPVYGSAMPSPDHRTDDDELRAIIARLLRARRDVTPSELVELLGEHVIWGPSDPPPAPVTSPEPAFAA